MKKSYILWALLLCLAPALASAALFRADEEVSLRQETFVDDVYIAGGNVTSIATVNGDLIAAGGNVFVSGSTTQDVMAAGGSINIVGQIGDDLRVAGGAITVSGMVGDDLVIAGGQVSQIAGSVIGGDVLAAGGRLVLDGEVRGNVRAVGGEVVINGNVSGNVDITADKVTIGEKAVVSGRLTYASPVEADIRSGSQVLGGVDYSRVVRTGQGAGAAVVGILINFLTLFVSAWVVQWFLRGIAVRLANSSADRFWGNLGLGLVILILTPIAVIIGMITIVGIPLSIIVLLAYIVDIIFATVFLPVFFGGLAWKYLNKSEIMILDWKTAILGALIVVIIGIIPIIGWLILFLSFLVVLGALIRLKKDYLVGIRE